jgi:hypothetical protein
METKAMLEKPTKTGGLGLTAQQADAVLALIKEMIPHVAGRVEVTQKIQSEYEAIRKEAEEAKKKREAELADRPAPSMVIPTAQPEPTQPESVLAEVKKDDFLLEPEKDIQDIKMQETAVSKKVDAEEVRTVDQILDGMADEAVAITGVAFENDDMKKRFRNLVSLYFRDLRDALETKSKFTMPVASGGMGMTDADADKVMALLKAKIETFRGSMAASADQAKQQYVQAQADKVMSETERQTTKEKAQLDRRFAQLTGSAPADAAASAPMPVAAPIKIPVVSLDKKPAASTPPAAPPANLPMAPGPAAPSPNPSPQPTAQSSKPVVSDVIATPRLTGPVEELRAITLTDFRRLSKDPNEATLKVKDKIDLLEDQGFEAKTQGIKAWQESEPNRVYLDMLRRSLEGKPVPDIINDLESMGKTVLTKAEFDSIMALNRKLRFG